MGQVVISELAAEITNDPKTLGLLAMGGNHAAVAAKLNERGASSETIQVQEMGSGDAQNAVDHDEFKALSAADRDGWLAIVGLDSIPVRKAGIRSQLGAIWTAVGSPTTRAALTVLQSRSASRAEILWGEETTVTIAHVGEAL